MAKLIGEIIKMMVAHLVDNQVNVSKDNEAVAVTALAQMYQDTYPDTAMTYNAIRKHGHAAVGIVRKQYGDTPKPKGEATLKINTAKIRSLSNDKLRSMIEVRAGKKSALLPFLTAEWNRRQKKVWVPSPDKVIEDLLLLVAEENKERVRKYLAKYVKR